MYLVKVTSPACDDFVSLGKTKEQAIQGCIDAYKDFYDYPEDMMKSEHGYDSYREYFTDYLGMHIYEISAGESVVCGYDVHYKDGKRIRKGD